MRVDDNVLTSTYSRTVLDPARMAVVGHRYRDHTVLAVVISRDHRTIVGVDS